MERLRNHTLWALGIAISILFVQIAVRADYTFLSDPLVKGVQVHSLHKHSFQTEAVSYPAGDLDPDYRLSPLNQGFVFENQGRFIGQYPVFLTGLYALFAGFGVKNLVFGNFLFIGILAFSYLRLGAVSGRALVYLVWGTAILATSLDFSEYPIFHMLAGLGYLFLYRSIHRRADSTLVDRSFGTEADRMSLSSGLEFGSVTSRVEFALGNFFLALAIWFRLEALLFIAVIYLVWGVFAFSSHDGLWNRTRAILSQAWLGFALTFLTIAVFFAYNHFSYGHFWGTRHLANIAPIELTLSDRLAIFFSLLGTWDRGSNFAIGYYLYSGVFFIVLVWALRSIRNRKNPQRLFHGAVAVVFSGLVALTAPNDGITLPARYVTLAGFPLVFLLSDFLQERVQSLGRLAKTGLGFLTTVSVLLSLVFVGVFYAISQESQRFQKRFANTGSDLIITSNDLVSGSFGLENTERRILALRTAGNLTYLSRVWADETIRKVDCIGYNSQWSEMEGAQNPILPLVDAMRVTGGFTCKEEQAFRSYRYFSCVR